MSGELMAGFSHAARVAAGVQLPEDLEVGPFSVIGYGDSEVPPPRIASRVSIGCFCVVMRDTRIGVSVDIDHYCRIGSGVRIGDRTKILYGSQLFNNCRVGEDCIIGGDLSERVIVEDRVTFMGSIAHSHRDPTQDWDTTDEASPIFREGCVVGVEASIIGGITIGKGAYVGAREVVRTDVPAGTAVVGGRRRPLDEMRGFVRSRL